MVRRTVMAVMVAMLLAALSAGAALAVSVNCPNSSEGRCFGTDFGDALYGTWGVDEVYGLGGADLIYGYAGRDLLDGGNERGWGDKILGGEWGDDIRGRGGDDALYGQRGNDRVNGGAGNDLVVGGYGYDLLNGGPGFDQVNARDGWRDTIILCGNEYDEIYYDRGLDVLRGCRTASSTSEPVSSETATSEATASESKDAGKNLVAAEPLKDLFGHTGKVLVKHDGREQCV